MWLVVAAFIAACLMLLIAGAQAVRGALHGLRGGRLGLQGRGGGIVYTSGWGARIAGAFYLVLGLACTAAGLTGLAYLLAKLG
jgi:hypothetical protein